MVLGEILCVKPLGTHRHEEGVTARVLPQFITKVTLLKRPVSSHQGDVVKEAGQQPPSDVVKEVGQQPLAGPEGG